MRKVISIVFLLLFSGTILTKAANKKFFITTSGNNKEAGAYLPYFESRVFNELKKNFPCAEINSLSSVASLLDFERQKQLLGAGDDEALNNIAQSIGCDYLVCLKVNVYGGTAVIDAFCADSRKAKVISRAASSVPHGDAGVDAVIKVAQEVVDGLKNIEICAFVGPVSITINSDLDSTHVEDYGVYCNESDQRYHKETVIKNHTFSDWKLQRKGIPWTDGTMTFYTDELSKTIEEDGCHKCKSGKREGGLVTTITSSMKAKGIGISHDSFREGKSQDDTRIELNFLENGQYLVVAKGTSQAVTGEDKVLTQAEGTCDNQPRETKIVPRDIRIPLRVIFGPYSGKTSDKFLQEKDTKVVKDPSTNEKQTITIDFNLQQKD